MIGLLSLVGVRGWIAAGIAAAIALPAGYTAGRWAESHATDARIAAAIAEADRRRMEEASALVDRANRARRGAELDGGGLSDDPWRRD
jgi:hypothetical protein